MRRFVYLGIETMAATALVIPAALILHAVFSRKSGWKRQVLLAVFAVYLAGVFTAVGMPVIQYITVDLSLNLMPLIDIVNSPVQYIKNTVLNIILFVPLGFLTPLLWSRFLKLKNIICLGFFLSLFIEIMQIFTYRVTDIDDLITNTAGAVLGLFLIKRCRKKETGDKQYSALELYSLITLVFAVMFLCRQPLLSIIYSFLYS